MIAVNAAFVIRLMTMMATVGLESWQICFGDSEHLASVAIFLIRKLGLIGGERRGCDSDDSTDVMNTLHDPSLFDLNSLSSTITLCRHFKVVTVAKKIIKN